jgi:hypothetical protein
MKHDIHNFVAECDVCQRNKGEIVKSLGTLQSLSIPPAIWKDISMDFITSLPKSGNKSIIMVVFYRLSKYAHFCTFNTRLQHPRWLKSSWIRSSSFMAVESIFVLPQTILLLLYLPIFPSFYSTFPTKQPIQGIFVIL